MSRDWLAGNSIELHKHDQALLAEV
jgi:hypothetical protein